MEFEDLQVIWNSQNQEKLFAINENSLYKSIKQRAESTNGAVSFVEATMIVVNLAVGLWLLLDAVWEQAQAYEYVLPILYLGFSLFAVVRSLTRRKNAVRFEPTLIGEIDKAISHYDILIWQNRAVLYWYILPLMLVVSGVVIIEQRYWALAVVLAIILVCHFATRWETHQHHLPKKRELEALRAKLLSVD